MNKGLVIAIVIIAILLVGLVVYQVAIRDDVQEDRDDRIESSALESDDQVFNEFDAAVDGIE